MIKAIFFDMTGVIYTDGFETGILKYEQDFNIPQGDLYAIVHDFQGWKDFSLGRISETVFYELCEERSGKYKIDWEKVASYIIDCSISNHEVIAFMRDLSKKYLIGVVSNNPKEWFEMFLKRNNIQDVVSVKAVSGYLHYRKPSKEIFEAALKMAKVQSQEAIYIDDREEMTVEAKELGINTLVFDGDLVKLTEKIDQLSQRS